MIQVVDRAFDILEYLAGHPDKCAGSSEIAQVLQISLQKANNLLRTLYHRGYLSQDRSRNYRLGPQCVYVGSFAVHWNELQKKIAGPLQKLAEISDLTAFCGVLENDHLFCLGKAQANSCVSTFPFQKWWNELHSTASGRLLLAYEKPAARRRILNSAVRCKLTEFTVVDPHELEKICQSIRECEYSLVVDESRKGVSSLAVPLRDSSGCVIAAIALSGRNSSWSQSSLEQKLKWLQSMAVLQENSMPQDKTKG